MGESWSRVADLTGLSAMKLTGESLLLLEQSPKLHHAEEGRGAGRVLSSPALGIGQPAICKVKVLATFSRRQGEKSSAV